MKNNHCSLLSWYCFWCHRFYFKSNKLQLLLRYTSSCVSKTDACYTQQGFCKIIHKYVTCNLLIIVIIPCICSAPVHRYSRNHIFFKQYQIFKGWISRMSEFQSLIHYLVVMKIIARIFRFVWDVAHISTAKHHSILPFFSSPVHFLIVAMSFSVSKYAQLWFRTTFNPNISW